MIGYIIFLVAYSIFHSAHVDIKRTPQMFRPLGYMNDKNNDSMRLIIGALALIAFGLAFLVMNWVDVLIYTLAIRLGYFLLLTILPNIFTSIRRANGFLFFVGFYLSILTFLYFLVFEIIVKS